MLLEFWWCSTITLNRKTFRVEVSEDFSANHLWFRSHPPWTALFQFWFSAVNYLKISEQRCFSNDQRWKINFSKQQNQRSTALFQRWFSLKQLWFGAVQRWFSPKQLWTALIFRGCRMTFSSPIFIFFSKLLEVLLFRGPKIWFSSQLVKRRDEQ